MVMIYANLGPGLNPGRQAGSWVSVVGIGLQRGTVLLDVHAECLSHGFDLGAIPAKFHRFANQFFVRIEKVTHKIIILYVRTADLRQSASMGLTGNARRPSSLKKNMPQRCRAGKILKRNCADRQRDPKAED